MVIIFLQYRKQQYIQLKQQTYDKTFFCKQPRKFKTEAQHISEYVSTTSLLEDAVKDLQSELLLQTDAEDFITFDHHENFEH
jgi:hypothetical protein